MKNRVLTLFAVASISFAAFTVSCSGDDDNKNTTPPSSFVVDRNNLQGEITDGEAILESGTYKLTGSLIVGPNAKLTIRPGVIIEATDFAQGQEIRYIAVEQDGEIDVQGSAQSPVIMTSTTKVPGSWGGLVVCGKARINKGDRARAEVSNLWYGGTEDNDNSGSIKYLRIEYPGYSYNSEKEFNGVSFFAVGSGTTVENVQVYESSDDGFEWFGGSVNTKNLSVINVSATKPGDDLFDWTEGWSGTNENWYGKRTNGGNRGIEADNNSDNHSATPISNPTIKNLTLVGTGEADSGSEAQAIKLRVGTNAKFENVVINNWKRGFDVQHAESLAFVTAGTLKATGVKFENVTTKAVGADNINTMFTESTTATGAGNGADVPTWATGWTRNN